MNAATKVTMDVMGRQVRKTLDAGLSPILCVGETKEEYEANLNKPVCALQLSKVPLLPEPSSPHPLPAPSYQRG
jgi:triosephosphate isomerase